MGSLQARLQARLQRWNFGSAVISIFADYLGLALLTPALPFYLDNLGFSDDKIAVWNGVITTSQFSAIIIGNLVWGRMCDRVGSQRSLLYAMIGDSIFFALSAAAPFGLEGHGCVNKGSGEFSSGETSGCGRLIAAITIAIVRAGAGFFTPLVSALLFIFDRADSPQAVVKGMGDYALATISAYTMGGVAVGLLYESVGWAWLNGSSAAVTALAALYVATCSAPPLIKGPRPKPKGLMAALRTADFLTHATTAFSCGYIMNASTFMFVIMLKEVFEWSARATVSGLQADRQVMRW